jgi:GR25 family glycosyltransferase involved in LPS biosynthesis
MNERPPSSYHGLYINLDRSLDRRRNVEQQLAELRLQDCYVRFPAVEGTLVNVPNSTLRPGEVGCFLSHHHALTQTRELGKCIHILEDDALLSRHVKPVVEDAISAGLFNSYDLLFTDSVVNCHLGLMKNLKKGFDEVKVPESGILRFSDLKLMNLAQIFFASCTSYIVSARSIDRVLALYEQEIANGLNTPHDIFVQQQVLAGKLRAACVFPFVTSTRIEDIVNSTIVDQAERAGRASLIVMALLGYSFFIDRDLDYAKKLLDQATNISRTKSDMHDRLIMQITEFMMSKDFEGI